MIINRHGRVVEWYASAQTTFGYTRDEAVGRTLSELIIPLPDRAAYAQHLESALGVDEVYVFDQQVNALHRDGHVFPCELAMHAFPTVGTRLFTVYPRNLSETQRAQARSAGLHQLTRGLAGVLTPEEVAQVVLNEAQHLMGARAVIVLGLDETGAHLQSWGQAGFSSLMADWFTQVPLNSALPVAEAARTGEALFLTGDEIPQRIPDLATLRDAELRRAAVLPLVVSDRVTGVLGLGFEGDHPFDDAERGFLTSVATVCAQALERARLYELTRVSETRYRSLVEATSQIVWTTPPSGAFDTDQPAWRAYTGQSVEAHLGWGWAEALHPEDRDAITQGWTQAYQSRTTFEGEARVRRHDEVYRLMEIRAVPVLDNAGLLREWVGVLTDITEQRLAQEELRERTRALERANGELDAFSYSVSHDLRAPVRHMFSFLGLARRALSTGANDKAAGYVSTAENAATRMNTMIDALLTLSRTSMQPIQLGPVDLQRLVNRVRQDLDLENTDRQVAWEIGNLPVVQGDSGTLELMLMNLLSNAVKYTSRRDRAVIRVWAEERPQAWAVFVADNGAGFDPRYAERLFGVFQRLHRADEFEGTGVGLANVRRIVERHGGQVWADAVPGKGATFAFTLPK
ncbi:PAS domain S-box protein [Deinococcus deserti]|uniref:histidine kinase n=1 Tax=Deinococcus deserti (strain DSM 17065 / CIP 109153 / LMG 22923 / VCD115) TaxID=546414 RepID=C1D2R5_DEIDV|nr:PAS domain S-box protein [Deinococcus deserti]ACO47704.1 putative histidine kinase, classic [Deinococcus deserti VCD115]